MKSIQLSFSIKYRSDLPPARQDYKPSRDYIYVNSNTFREIYTSLGIKWDRNSHPRKRPVVRISKEGERGSIYRRLMSGNSLGLTKNEVFMDWEALSFLNRDEDQRELKLEFRKSNALMLYRHHFDAQVRWGFNLSIASLFVGVVSLLVGFVALFK